MLSSLKEQHFILTLLRLRPTRIRVESMKKLTIILCLTAVFAMPSVAQHRIGGDFGFGVGSSKATGSKNSNTSLVFVLEPQYLYALNEKWEIGGSMTLGTIQWMDKRVREETYFNDYTGNTSTRYIKTKNRTSGFYWAINPTMRYRLIGYEKFGFWLEGLFTLGVEQDAYYETTDGVTNRDKYDFVNFHWGLNFNPVLTYQFTDKFRMETSLGFLGVGLNGLTIISDGEAQSSAVDFGVHLANGSVTNIIDHAGTVVDAYGDVADNYGQLIGGRCLAKRLDLRIGFVYTF